VPDIIADARALVARARETNKCLREARNVERALEDLKSAASAGNAQVAVGCLFAAGGIAVGLLTGWTGLGAAAGLGLAAGGLAGVANGLAAKKEAMEKAMRDLRRAMEDLRECLGS
jgi:hypothetical protein